jgi:glycerol-3-phosphate acyltransferase PlsY
MNILFASFAIIIAYLFGSISSSIIVCKLMRLPDPRTTGSKNPGATNVLRIGGKKAAIITLLGDLLKGLIPVVIAQMLGFSSIVLALVAIAAFIGHLFPIFFRFEGGKGVATALGCLIALSWPSALCWMGVWVLLAATFRYSSLASLTASILSPVFIWVFTGDIALTCGFLVIAIVLTIRHKENIRKLLAGQESKLGKKKV